MHLAAAALLACCLAVCVSATGPGKDKTKGFKNLGGKGRGKGKGPPGIAGLPWGIGADSRSKKGGGVLSGFPKLPIFNTTGTDLKQNGSCKLELGTLCSDVTWGDGHMANCLRKQQQHAKKRKEENPVNAMCAKELNVFYKQAAAWNYKNSKKFKGKEFTDENLLAVSPTAGFREACREDAMKFCAKALGGKLLPCLRSNKRKLDPQCAEKVFKVQKQEAADMALDVPFMAACLEDLQNIEECSGLLSSDSGGEKKSCLKRHREELSANCSLRLFRREQEDSEDIRLNVGTFTACTGEIAEFCADKEFGEGRMLKCLWERKHRLGFGERCRSKVEGMTRHQASDYRLDFRIRTRCKEDIRNFCEEEKQRVDALSVTQLFGDGWSEAGASGEVLRCLKTNYTRLGDDRCKEEVQRLVSVQALDAEADPVLARACREEIDTLCAEVKPEEVHQCLRKNFGNLSEACRREEIVQGKLEGSDIAMNPILKTACAPAVTPFCPDVQHGEARVLDCLHEHVRNAEMPAECQKALLKDAQASNNDWRLKYGIHHHCKKDVKKLCRNAMFDKASRGDGKIAPVLSCLKGARAKKQISDRACEAELVKLLKQGAQDIRDSPGDWASCVDDVALLCVDVKPGGGRVHDCLLHYRYEISEECAKSEFEEQKLEAEDARLSPKAMDMCGMAMKTLCADVPFEDGKMWRCLEDNKDDELMPLACAGLVMNMTRQKNEEFFLNPKLAHHCEADAKALCPEGYTAAEKEDFSSYGGVIGCLIDKRSEIKDPKCLLDLKRKQGQRAKDIGNDPKQRGKCKTDIKRFCSSPTNIPIQKRRSRTWIRDCLQEHIDDISEECKAGELMSMQMQSEAFDNNPILADACGWSMAKLCKNDGRVGCLLDHMQDPRMNPDCRKALEDEQQKRTKSIFFNPGLLKACQQDLQELQKNKTCDNMPEERNKANPSATSTLNIIKEFGKGSIDCLTKNKDKVHGKQCRKEISKVLKRQASDYRAKPMMEKDCKEDVDHLCFGVAKGEGRVHHCLRQHVDEIQSEKCKAFVAEVKDAEADDAMLNPQVAKKCSNEVRTFCPDVPPGEAQVLACLGMNKKKSGFGQPCSRALQRVQASAEVLSSADKKLAKIKKGQGGLDTDMIAHEIKRWLSQNRGWLETWGMPIIAGFGLLCACGGAIAVYCIVASQCKKGGYVTVVPRDLES